MSGTILTGLLAVNGDPVPLCLEFCGKPDGTLCGRPAGHPVDEWGHLCRDCASAQAGDR